MKNLLLTLAALCFIVVNSAQGVEQILTAPFADEGINLQQGWYYHPDTDCDDDCGHSAIDYVMGAINDGDNWDPFAVLAAHSGTAVYLTGYNGGLGNHVTITLDQPGTEPTYQTIYAHLDSSPLPVGNEVTVNKGDFIGIAGLSGAANNVIHLHFVFKVNGTTTDPYDVYNIRPYYPENGGSCGDDVYWVNCPPQKVAPTLTNTRKSTALNNPNPYGWSQSPTTLCGDFDDIYWWHGFDGTDLYFADGTSKRCYVSVDEDNNDGGIVYDVLGGARQAYYVGWGDEWDQWEVMDISCGSCPNPAGTGGSGEGGPQSCLGMPITNRYEESSNHWRQDFQKGYIVDGDVYCYGVVNNFNTYAPGRTDDGWNKQWSYIIADCYDRFGARRGMGCALQPVNINWKSTAYHTQRYDFGEYDQGMIVYDPESWIDDAGGDNKAYFIYGGFYEAYSFAEVWNDQTNSYEDMPWAIGSPVADRSGNTQQFKYGYMVNDNGITRVYDASDTQIWNSSVGSVSISGSGGGAPDNVILSSGPGQMVMKDHLTFSEQNGNTVWFTTHYSVYGGNYGSTDSRVKIYCNGSLVTGYKENNRLYITSGYNASYTYEADYPRTIATLTAGSTYNGWRTMYAPTSIIGGTWGNTHNSVVVREYSVGITAYKEVNGLTNLVITEDEYDAGATYTAQYASVSDSTLASKVSLGPGQMVYKEYVHRDFQIGNIVWFRLYYPIYGADYSQTDERIKLYKNGSEVTVHKENVWVYITSGYDSTASYEVDYPRARATLTAGGTYNNWRTLYAPSTVWGATWGNDHASVKVFENGVQVTAYKETGTNVLVIPESEYEAGKTYTAEYVEVWGTYAGKVVSGDQGGIANNALPAQFTLSQNYPNPFNPATSISYTLPSATHVQLDVYNILGQRVVNLVNTDQAAGTYQITWDAGRYASGVYFYRISTSEAVETKKMLLLK